MRLALAALAAASVAAAACGADAERQAAVDEVREESAKQASPAGSQEATALAERLMEALGYAIMTESIPDVFSEASGDSLVACTPATPEADVQALTRTMREELEKAMPGYYERIRDSYVRRLSLEELQALVDFYESPVGQGVAEAAAVLTYDQFNAQSEIDRAALRAYERLGWCDNAL